MHNNTFSQNRSHKLFSAPFCEDWEKSSRRDICSISPLPSSLLLGLSHWNAYSIRCFRTTQGQNRFMFSVILIVSVWMEQWFNFHNSRTRIWLTIQQPRKTVEIYPYEANCHYPTTGGKVPLSPKMATFGFRPFLDFPISVYKDREIKWSRQSVMKFPHG